MNNRKGFTLVEIMIVVAIIALLAAIAIPNLIGARKTANEAAAKANIKVLGTEEETYSAGAGNGAYATAAILGAAIGTEGSSAAYQKYCAAPCTTATTGCGGYYYTCTPAAGSYSFTATPVTPGTTGTKIFTITTGGQLTES